MPTGLFVNPPPTLRATAVLSASSQAGLTAGTPVSATANLGALRLRGSSVLTPVAAAALDVTLQTGGLANGWFTSDMGTAGATFRWRNTGDGSTSWRGYTENQFVTYCRIAALGSALIYYPYTSDVRTLANDTVGYLSVSSVAGASWLKFHYKAARTNTWTQVTIATSGVSIALRPALVVTTTGRLLAYAYNPTDERIDGYYSDDHGATWAAWAVLSSGEMRPASSPTAGTICVEVVGDAMVMVLGGSESGNATLQIGWSLDGGQNFTRAYAGSSVGTIDTTVTKTGQALLAYNTGGATDGHVVPLIYGGSIGSDLKTYVARSASPQVALCTHDDGTLWLFYNGAGADALTAIDHQASYDNGATWDAVGVDATVYDNETLGGVNRGPLRMTAGSWRGSIILLLTTDTVTAATDNGTVELWLGGYDTLTECYTSSSEGHRGTNPYARYSLLGDEFPDNLGWTLSNIGAGATISKTLGGIKMVSVAGADNSNYNRTFSIAGTGDGFRFRYNYRVNSGGSINNDSATVFFSCSDGVNRQWIKIRHSSIQLRALDPSGSIGTATMAASSMVEVFVAFNHDYTAGGGLVTILYRAEGQTNWLALCSAVAVAEEAGVATETLLIGGTVVTSTVDWEISGFFVAEGGRWASGFTNPTDLHGRPISAAIDVPIHSGLALGAFGGSGVAGDTYTFATTYRYAASNLWLSPRLPCRWQTANATGAHNAVFYSAASLWHLDVVTVHGTNWRTGYVEVNTSDSWGTPANRVALDATVWQGTITTSGLGYVLVDGAPFIPHEYRSTPGRRWFLRTSSATYEIADNGESTIHVADLPSGLSGTIYIFGDRMGVVLPVAWAYAYLRLVIDDQTSPDGAHRTGYIVPGRKHAITTPYDSGFVDRYQAAAVVSATSSGHVHAGRVGSEHPELRIAWGLIDHTSNDYMRRIVALFRSFDGETRPFPFWRDVNDQRTIGLYRLTGSPVVVENSYGELSDAFDRLAQVILREETT